MPRIQSGMSKRHQLTWTNCAFTHPSIIKRSSCAQGRGQTVSFVVKHGGLVGHCCCLVEKEKKHAENRLHKKAMFVDQNCTTLGFILIWCKMGDSCMCYYLSVVMVCAHHSRSWPERRPVCVNAVSLFSLRISPSEADVVQTFTVLLQNASFSQFIIKQHNFITSSGSALPTDPIVY